MRLAVCGGPDYSRRDFVFECLDRAHRKANITTLLREDEKGASAFAGAWAVARLVGSTTYAKARRIPGAPDPIELIFGVGKPEALVAFPGGEREEEIVNRALQAGLKVWRPT